LLVFGNNSKTVNIIRNLTWVKMISTGRSNYPEMLKKIWLPILELLPFFRQIFKMFILFVVFSLHSTSISYSFWNKGQKVLTFWKCDERKGNNSKLGTQINFKITGHVDLNMQIWLPILELLPFFRQIFKMFILFVFYFKNYKR
jgi:hypothetical protein